MTRRIDQGGVKNDREKLRSDSLNLLRFPLAVAVVLVHVFAQKDALPNDAETPRLFLEVSYFVDGFLRFQNVPIYFFISGYVFFLGITLTKEKYQQKLKNRTKTLLIPYLIWNTASILLVLAHFLPFLQSVSPYRDLFKLDFSLPAILYSYWDDTKGICTPIEAWDTPNFGICPANHPLWFLRDLMIVALTTPAINWLLKRTRNYLVWALGIAWFVLSYFEVGHLSQLSRAYFFFVWGAYMSLHQKDMLADFGRFARLSSIAYVTLGLLYVASMHADMPIVSSTIKQLNIMAGLLFAYNMAAWLLRHRVCRPNPLLASASFFIYVAHPLLCSPLRTILIHYIGSSTSLGLLAIHTATAVLTISLLLLLFWLMRQYTPSVLKVIAGRK